MDCESTNDPDFPSPTRALLAIDHVQRTIESCSSLDDIDELTERYQSAIYWIERFGIEVPSGTTPVERLTQFAQSSEVNGRDPSLLLTAVDGWLWLGAANSCCELATQLRNVECMPTWCHRGPDEDSYRSEYVDLIRRVRIYADLLSCSIAQLGLQSPSIMEFSLIPVEEIDAVGVIAKCVETFGYPSSATSAWYNFTSRIQVGHSKALAWFRSNVLDEIPRRREVPFGWEPATDDAERSDRRYPDTPIATSSDLRVWLDFVLCQIKRAKADNTAHWYHKTACRELRNVRCAFYEWGIPIPADLNDDPVNVHEAERRLEKLVKSLRQIRLEEIAAEDADRKERIRNALCAISDLLKLIRVNPVVDMWRGEAASALVRVQDAGRKAFGYPPLEFHREDDEAHSWWMILSFPNGKPVAKSLSWSGAFDFPNGDWPREYLRDIFAPLQPEVVGCLEHWLIEWSDDSQTDASPSPESNLQTTQEAAYQSYRVAEHKLDNPTDREAYVWLMENGPVEYELPAFETWVRYVRKGRKAHGTQKNSPRAGRIGRSITRLESVDGSSTGDDA